MKNCFCNAFPIEKAYYFSSGKAAVRGKGKLSSYNKVLKQSIRAAKQAHYYDIFNEHINI